MNSTELGTLGEALAERYLLKKGYTILDKNIRFKKWEIDLVALDGEKLVIVEVKTRQTAEIGEPWRAVTRNKQRQIIKVADYYIQSGNIDRETRFDIISIVHNSYRTDIEHILNAFYPLV
ncbi:MAG: YraN family protein [Flavobacteriia bacterium]|jgi:putative endonuclease